ncbi:hypothetical protein EYF80_029834 [Liparis tanakae]|uniref:Uncharacterized protein n=1 Tax=Liparis tanakae TaxID=230148 RepID=A0A4Z2H4Z7_9TELE|nr:hypothetical protein EYF80_029834 [Liparis tanakae]
MDEGLTSPNQEALTLLRPIPLPDRKETCRVVWGRLLDRSLRNPSAHLHCPFTSGGGAWDRWHAGMLLEPRRLGSQVATSSKAKCGRKK